MVDDRLFFALLLLGLPWLGDGEGRQERQVLTFHVGERSLAGAD
jgi:hypothetical protein